MLDFRYRGVARAVKLSAGVASVKLEVPSVPSVDPFASRGDPSERAKRGTWDSGVGWCARRKCFLLPGTAGVPARGLKPVLKQLFFPAYAFDRAREGPSFEELVGMPPRKAGTKHKNAGARTKRTGVALGTRVDREIERGVKLAARLGLSFAQLVGDADAGAGSAGTKDGENLAAFRRTAHIYTKRFCRYCHKQKWRPEAAQVFVAHRGARLATAADVVVSRASPKRKREREYVVLEVKVGFRSYLGKYASKSMAQPFGAFSDCPANQHLLQLMFTRRMVRAAFPDRAFGPGYVIVLNDLGTAPLALKTPMLAAEAVGWTRLCETAQFASPSSRGKHSAAQKRIRNTPAAKGVVRCNAPRKRRITNTPKK